MNELLQKHGCSNVFTVPEGLRELMSDISREVLREQPPKIYNFIANYLSVLLITREHGILAVKVLEDLCDCRPSVSEHLVQLGLQPDQANELATIIKEEIEGTEPTEGKESVKELEILKKILKRNPLDEDLAAKVCHVSRNAYRDYWYRKKLLEKGLKVEPDEPWEIAAQHTLEIYKKTKPSFAELNRATEKIQAAYRGYYVRKSMLKHIKNDETRKQQTPKEDLPGAPLDIAASRDIELGHVIDIKEQVLEDNIDSLFEDKRKKSLGISYDPLRTLTHKSGLQAKFDDDVVSLSDEHRTPSRLIAIKDMDAHGSKKSTKTHVYYMFDKKSERGKSDLTEHEKVTLLLEADRLTGPKVADEIIQDLQKQQLLDSTVLSEKLGRRKSDIKYEAEADTSEDENELTSEIIKDLEEEKRSVHSMLSDAKSGRDLKGKRSSMHSVSFDIKSGRDLREKRSLVQSVLSDAKSRRGRSELSQHASLKSLFQDDLLAFSDVPEEIREDPKEEHKLDDTVLSDKKSERRKPILTRHGSTKSLLQEHLSTPSEVLEEVRGPREEKPLVHTVSTLLADVMSEAGMTDLTEHKTVTSLVQEDQLASEVPEEIIRGEADSAPASVATSMGSPVADSDTEIDAFIDFDDDDDDFTNEIVEMK